MLLVIAGRVVAAPFLDGRQTAALRRIPDQAVSDNRYEYRNRSREQEGSRQEIQVGVSAIKPAAEPHGAVGCHRPDKGPTHIMGAVPDAHPSTPLLDGEPVRHHSSAGRPAHAVEPANEEVHRGHERNRKTLVRGPNPVNRNHHEGHRQSGQDQAQRQEPTGIAAVGHAGHHELGDAVGDGVHRQHNTKLPLAEAEGRQHGDSHGEVLADDVETGIADEDSQEDLGAHPLIAGVGSRTCLFGQEGRRSEKTHITEYV